MSAFSKFNKSIISNGWNVIRKITYNNINVNTVRFFSKTPEQTENISAPETSDNIDELMNRLPKYKNNDLGFKMPEGPNNPFVVGENDISGEITDPTLKKHNIAQPTSKYRSNIGTIGSLDEVDNTFDDSFNNPNYERNQTAFQGFGGNVLKVNGIMTYSSVIGLPGMFFCWKPDSWEEVTPESVSFLSFLHPLPDVILFGTGLEQQPVSKSLHVYLKAIGVPYEVLTSNSAIGTFNLLNEDNRRVVICALRMDPDEHRMYQILAHEKRSKISQAPDLHI